MADLSGKRRCFRRDLAGGTQARRHEFKEGDRVVSSVTIARPGPVPCVQVGMQERCDA